MASHVFLVAVDADEDAVVATFFSLLSCSVQPTQAQVAASQLQGSPFFIASHEDIQDKNTMKKVTFQGRNGRTDFTGALGQRCQYWASAGSPVLGQHWCHGVASDHP